MHRMKGRRLFWITSAIGILALPLAWPLTASDPSWETAIVDHSVGGSFASMRIDKYGNAHVAYVQEGDGILQYSFWDHGLKKWFTTTLDRGAGFCSLALDSKQRPRISYAAFGKLKYALWDGTSWKTEAIPMPSREITFYTSIALDSDDNPSISFYEIVNAAGEQVLRLRVVGWRGGVWRLRTVDSAIGSGKFNSIAIDSAGRVHVAYGNVQYENAGLRYAQWDGAKWDNQIIEGAGVPGTYRQAVSLILDKHDTPHIAYSDLVDRVVKYATQVNGKWQVQIVGPIGAIAYPDRNGLALDEHGTPYVSYYDAKAGALKVAHRQGEKWASEVVDEGFVGFTSSLQIHNGIIWVAYSGGSSGGLYCARRRLEPTASDQLETRSALK